MATIPDINNAEGGSSVRGKLNALIKAINAIVTSDSLFNILRINASLVKDVAPTTTKYLRDDGTWQTVNANQNLNQTVTNGGTVTGSDGITYIVEIDKANDQVIFKANTIFHNPISVLGQTQAKVMTLGTGNQLVSTGINVVDIATKAYADGLVAGLLDDRGSYDSSTNLFPSTGGSGTSGTILKGDIWYISVAGILGGQAVTVGDSVRALVDSPAQTATNWSVLETNIGYVPENVANKSITMTGNETSNALYLTAKAIYDWAVALFQPLLVSGTNIRTVNSNTLLGSTDIKLGTLRHQVIQLTSSLAPTVDTTGFNKTFVDITALAGNINLSTNLTGSPQNGDVIWFQIKDNGTSRTITAGTLFESKGETIPPNTIISKRLNFACTWDSTTNKWGCIAVIQEI